MSDQPDPDKIYRLSQAATFFVSPSARGPGHLLRETLRQWIVRGIMSAERRRVGKKTFWFVSGAEIERLLATEPWKATQPRVPTPAARRKRVLAAYEALGLPPPV